jgi:peptidoglycan/LPS O-acetylase OafA/YrhL
MTALSQAPPRQPDAVARIQVRATQVRDPRLDALRGFAALWVYLYHLGEGGHLDRLRPLVPHWLWSVLIDAGHLGVPVFFVLSGYVMALTARSAAFDGPGARRFVAKRLWRLTPPYWFAVVVACAFVVLKAAVSAAPVALPSVQSLLLHALYLQNVAGVPTLNFVFWTLAIELQFYLAYAAVAWALHRCANGASAQGLDRLWTVVALLSLAWLAFVPGMPQDVWFVRTWYVFLAGVLVQHAVARRTARADAVVFIMVLLALALFHGDTFGLATACIAAALLAMQGLVPSDALRWRPLQSLALVSYSVYLLHNPLTGAVSNIVHRQLGLTVLADAVTLVTALALVLLAAHAAYRWVERPAIRWSHQLVR